MKAILSVVMMLCVAATALTVGKVGQPKTANPFLLTPPKAKASALPGNALDLMKQIVNRCDSGNVTDLADLFEDDAVGIYGSCNVLNKTQLVAMFTEDLTAGRAACLPSYYINNGNVAYGQFVDAAVYNDSNSTFAAGVAGVIVSGPNGKIQQYLEWSDPFTGPQANQSSMLNVFGGLLVATQEKDVSGFASYLAPDLIFNSFLSGYPAQGPSSKTDVVDSITQTFPAIVAAGFYQNFGKPIVMCNYVVYPVIATIKTTNGPTISNQFNILKLHSNMTVAVWDQFLDVTTLN